MPLTAAEGQVNGLFVKRFIEEPARVFLENLRNYLEQPLRRNAFTVLDHRQVGHRGSRLGIYLDAANREVFKRKRFRFLRLFILVPRKCALRRMPW